MILLSFLLQPTLTSTTKSRATAVHTTTRAATARDELRETTGPTRDTVRRKKVKASSYIAQYLVLRTAQSVLHFTSLTGLFTQTPSRLLWEASSHMLQLMRVGCSYTYPPLSIARYSFIQLSELEQCRVKKRAQGFNTAARIGTRVLVVESLKCPHEDEPSYPSLVRDHTKVLKQC